MCASYFQKMANAQEETQCKGCKNSFPYCKGKLTSKITIRKFPVPQFFLSDVAPLFLLPHSSSKLKLPTNFNAIFKKVKIIKFGPLEAKLWKNCRYPLFHSYKELIIPYSPAIRN